MASEVLDFLREGYQRLIAAGEVTAEELASILPPSTSEPVVAPGVVESPVPVADEASPVTVLSPVADPVVPAGVTVTHPDDVVAPAAKPEGSAADPDKVKIATDMLGALRMIATPDQLVKVTDAFDLLDKL